MQKNIIIWFFPHFVFLDSMVTVMTIFKLFAE